MNILISGVMGSGASYLCEYIINNHPEVNIYGISRWGSTKTDSNIKHIKNKITVIECDLNDLTNTIRALDTAKPDMIFNMAAHANVRVAFESPLAVLQNNIFSTAHLLEATRMVCPKAIFNQCSTSEVCGTPETAPITEDHQLNPSNPYAVSKLAGEKLAYAYHKSWNLNVIITRCFAYINPRRKDLFATAFARQVARIEAGLQDKLYHGNLASLRTLIDVRDVAAAYWMASQKCDIAVPYNVGGTRPIAIGEFLEILKSKAKVPIISELDKRLLRNSDITKQIPDVSRFIKMTGWQPKYTLDESIEWLLEECRKEVTNESQLIR